MADADTIGTQWAGLTIGYCRTGRFPSVIILRSRTGIDSEFESQPGPTASLAENTSVTRPGEHTLVITPIRIGPRPPYPSRDDGGPDTVRSRAFVPRRNSGGCDGRRSRSGPSVLVPSPWPSGVRRRPARWMPMTRHVPSGGDTFHTRAGGADARPPGGSATRPWRRRSRPPGPVRRSHESGPSRPRPR
jgi:hypothetical protein